MKAAIDRIFNSQKGFDAAALRIGAGLIFTAHGAQKLFGWFGGYGLQATGEWMSSIGLEPGIAMAALAGGAEFFGGLLLMAGLLTRPAALVLSITMVVAIISVHWSNGLFISNNGYEFGLALLVISIALLLRGGGSASIDRLIANRGIVAR